jgi:hypothetical protein
VERDEDTPDRVIMTLEIDENNLIEVSAALEGDPRVRVSRALSRGKADERLYRALEETILEANREGYDTYRMEDIESRALSAIDDINRVIDERTGATDEALHARAALKIEKAGQMAAEGRSSTGAIAFGEHALAQWSLALRPEKQAEIREGIDRLRRMDDEGSLQDNIAAHDALQRNLKDLGLVNVLMDLEQASEMCQEQDPRWAARLEAGLDRMLRALFDEDHDRIQALIDELHPEAHEVLAGVRRQAASIVKDLRQGASPPRGEVG